ncbi:MAG TPA: GNAT family N-acetyltransferase [Usitatibacter sp.]|nr:GNAT family N-acetyltransferase [Usitatibacter sp.]
MVADRGYPGHLASELSIAGQRVEIRPVRPSDAGRVAEFAGSLSDETWRLRFFGGRVAITDGMLDRATRVDYRNHLALVASSEARMIAGARYVASEGDTACEFAIVVADDWQGRGLGRVMMRKLIEAAKATPFATMVGYVAAGNRGMRGLCRSFSFTDRAVPGDMRTRIVELELRARIPPA